MTYVILVAEDELPQRIGLIRHLEEAGYRTVEAADGQEALDAIAHKTVDLAILDIMMPKINGYEVCRTMRDDGCSVPVILLTARAALDDRLDGFDCGADDYVTKPFAVEELLKRISAILRRSAPKQEAVSTGDWTFDFSRGTAVCGKKAVEFTHRELAMLELLIARDGQPVSRDEFLDRFWPEDSSPTNRTIDTMILGIRHKLEAGYGITIETVHRVGYRVMK